MRAADTFRFSRTALGAYPLRTSLILLAMAIGVASVIILTSLGEGARQFVGAQFRMLGANMLIVLPGRSETTGGLPPLLGTTPRDLTLDDALALRHSPAIRAVAPIIFGAASVSYAGREREVSVMGSTPSILDVRELQLERGVALPAGDPRIAASLAILGHKLSRELFGHSSPLGEWLRIGDRRFRVIGVLSSKGQSLGMDMSDMVLIPVASARSLFNAPSLFRILVQAQHQQALTAAKKDILRIIRQRHDGDDDITVITQDALISTVDDILRMLTWAVGGIAAISLIVAGILIMNVMLVAVSQRREEIGLLKALGAPTRQVLHLFLSEALMLSLAGGALGLLAGLAGNQLIHALLPDFPVVTPLWAILAAVVVTLATGLLFGSIPARRASRLDPVIALSS
ncbi:MAG: ABC transporter permease [Pseudomonadota bacterium]